MFKKYRLLSIPIIILCNVHNNNIFAADKNFFDIDVEQDYKEPYFLNSILNTDEEYTSDELLFEPKPPKILIESTEKLESIFGIKKEFLLTISRIESNYKQVHSPYQSSTANGPYQFTENGWKGDIDLCKNSNKIPNVDIKRIYRVSNRIDYKKSSFILACAMSAIKDNLDKKYKNDDDRYAALYLNHFLGTYDFLRIEDYISKNPNTTVIKVFSRDKIYKNKTLLYMNKSKTTVSDVFNNVKNIIKKQTETVGKVLELTQKSM